MTAPTPKPAAVTLESFLRLPGGPRLHAAVYFLYCLAIILALLWFYGRGDFVTAPFVYQGF